jgi:plasmid stabilization system protein ParE
LGEVFRKARRDVRRFHVGNYIIYYEPIPSGIRVLRVLHGAREQLKEV